MNGGKGHSIGLLLIVGVVLVGSRTAPADYVFGEPVNMGARINTPQTDAAATISPDGLELYFCSNRPSAPGSKDVDLYVTKRASLDAEWGEPVRLPAPLNFEGANEFCPWLTQDGLALYFNSDRPGGSGGMDLWVARRATRDGPWGEPVNVGPPINSKNDEHRVAVFNDERELYFCDWNATRAGSFGWADVYVSTRASKTDPWSEPQNLGPVLNSPNDEYGPTYIFPDGLHAYFTSYDREGGAGGGDIWIITRPSPTAPWETMLPVGPPLNSPDPNAWDVEVVFCPVAPMAYMHSTRTGGLGEFDLWQTPVIPIVDFNADGKVDLVDLVMLIDNWGTSDTLCDIGPMPWGDGKVDIGDLKVFMTYYEKENPPVQP